MKENTNFTATVRTSVTFWRETLFLFLYYVFSFVCVCFWLDGLHLLFEHGNWMERHLSAKTFRPINFSTHSTFSCYSFSTLSPDLCYVFVSAVWVFFPLLLSVCGSVCLRVYVCVCVCVCLLWLDSDVRIFWHMRDVWLAFYGNWWCRSWLRFHTFSLNACISVGRAAGRGLPDCVCVCADRQHQSAVLYVFSCMAAFTIGWFERMHSFQMFDGSPLHFECLNWNWYDDDYT